MKLDEMYNKTGEEIFNQIVSEATGPTALIKFKGTMIGNKPEIIQQHHYISGELSDAIHMLKNDRDSGPETINQLVAVKEKIFNFNYNNFEYNGTEVAKRINKINEKLTDIRLHQETVNKKIDYLREAKEVIGIEIELMRLGIDA